MSETYPNKGTRETLFAGHTPSSVGFDCKITIIFWIKQIKKPFMSENINGNVMIDWFEVLFCQYLFAFYIL